MTKIYFSICLSILLITGVHAQQTFKIKNSIKTDHHKGSNTRHSGASGSPMQIAGSIVCNNGYVAGTTMNLYFTIATTNADQEYIDSLAIIFPAGFTILATSANPSFPSADTVTAGAAEHFNDISAGGDTITWGSHVNDIDSTGGIWANPPQMFSIKVAISSTVSGNQTATFFAHGDGYPATLGDTTSGNLSGTIIISPPAAKDLGAISATVTNGCAATNTTSVSFKFWNVGTSAQSNFHLGYIVNGGAVITETYTLVINPNDTAVYNFTAPIAMVADTIYNIKVFTALSTDVVLNNDTTSAVSYTSHNAPYSSGFEGTQHDTLGWSTQHINGTGGSWVNSILNPHAGDYSETLFSEATGISDDWLFSPCINLTAGPLYQIRFYSMRYPDFLYSGQLNVWLGKNASPSGMDTALLIIDTVQVGLSSTSYQLDSVLFKVSTSGSYVIGFEGKNTDSTKQIALLIDDVSVTDYGYMGIKTTIKNNTDIIIYPNPTTGLLNIITSDTKTNVEVYNIMGQKVMSKVLNGGVNTIDISDLNNDVYSLKIMQNNTLTAIKIVKAN